MTLIYLLFSVVIVCGLLVIYFSLQEDKVCRRAEEFNFLKLRFFNLMYEQRQLELKNRDLENQITELLVKLEKYQELWSQ